MIRHNQPSLGNTEYDAAARALASGWVAQGPEVEAFEAEFCDFLGLPPGSAVAVSSGSAALFLALHILGARGKTVALPVYSCAAVSNATVLAGAQMQFLDVEPGQPNINGNQIGTVNADIVVAAHMFGVPIDLRNISKAVVLEDCAQALGAKFNGTRVGVQGAVAAFSFSATKLITSGGQGGMVVSRDLTLAAAARDYRQFDQRHDQVRRFNFQMTDLQAAVGRAQLKRLPEFLARRDHIFERYKAMGLKLLESANGAAEPVRYRAVLHHDRPQDLIGALGACGISAIVPVEEWELLDSPSKYPHARRLAHTTVSIPIYPNLEKYQIDQIVDALLRFYG